MKILFVLTYYRPHWTGLTQYAARLAEGLARNGHKVEVLCSQHDKKLPLREEINKVKIFRLPYLFRFLRSVVMPSFSWQLWRKLKNNDTVIVYLPFQEVLLAAFVAKLLRKRLYLVHNGDLVLPDDCGLLCRLVEKTYYLTTSLAIRLAKKVIVQTKDYSEHSPLLSKFKNKWAVILPLYEAPKITTREVKEFKKKFFLEGKILIGFSGRFVEEKGIFFLLNTIPLVVKQNPKIHFALAGDYNISYEDYWGKIKDLIEENKDNVTLLGLLKGQREIFAFYRSLDVYIQPSRTDCFPSSLVEALLSGIPCVCTDIPGARWAVLKTGMGEVVRSCDPKALAEGIINVLKDKRRYLNNYGLVKKIFNYTKTLSDYESLME